MPCPASGLPRLLAAGMPTKLGGFDLREPTGHQGGKPRAIARLREIFPYETVSRTACQPAQSIASRWSTLPPASCQMAWVWRARACTSGRCCTAVLVLLQIVMVGDGITDLEAVQESGGADMFVGFGGAHWAALGVGLSRQRLECAISSCD